MSVEIRNERPGDRQQVFDLNAAAFPSDAEARLVDTLRDTVSDRISLVALQDGEIVGHILFTPVSVDAVTLPRMLGLAPMAVLPPAQLRGIGSALVTAGLRQCREAGFAAVVVLGHPAYYPRFGFVPAATFGLRSEYEAPDEAFMALELEESCLADIHGTVRYDEAFAAL